MNCKPRFFLLCLGSVCLSAASPRILAEEISAFPLPPRASGLGMGGTQGVVSGEGMAALAGNQNGIWLVDAQSKSAFQSSYVGSVGTGFRMVQGDERILGAYLFGDGNVSETNHQYWFVSPGVESMGTLMDFRMNGYIPVGTQRNLTSSDFADNLGNYNYVTFTGHDQYDAIINNYEEVGWGLDGEAGIRLARLHGMRLYAGGYHFNIQDGNNINGVSGRVQLPINSFLELNVRDTYDNDQHNTIEIGLRVTLGGVNKFPANPNQPIRERLLDPIERNLATLGQGTAEPVLKEQEVINVDNVNNEKKQDLLERDNIWFFSESGTDTFVNSSSCTAEHPCVNTNFTQATIDGINAHPNSPVVVRPVPSANPSFYLAPAQYSILTINGMTATPYTFTNDLVYGRSPDFTQPQQAAFLNGAVILNGQDLFDSVIFHNDLSFTQAVGLTLNTGSSLILVNSIVGTDEATQGYATAMTMDNATLNATTSEIHAYSNAQDISAIGIETQGLNGSVINLVDSQVQVTGEVLQPPSGLLFVAAGLLLNDNAGSNVTLNQSVINSEASSPISSPNFLTVGGILVGPAFFVQEENIHLTNNSIINVTASLSSDSVIGIAGIGTDPVGTSVFQSMNVILEDSAINVEFSGNAGIVLIGGGIFLFGDQSETLQMTNSQINVSVLNNNSGMLMGGIYMDGPPPTIDIDNSSLLVQVSTPASPDMDIGGIEIPSGGSVTLNNTDITVNVQANALGAGPLRMAGILGGINGSQTLIDLNNSSIDVQYDVNAIQAVHPFTSISDIKASNTTDDITVINSNLTTTVNAGSFTGGGNLNKVANILVNEQADNITIDVEGSNLSILGTIQDVNAPGQNVSFQVNNIFSQINGGNSSNITVDNNSILSRNIIISAVSGAPTTCSAAAYGINTIGNRTLNIGAVTFNPETGPVAAPCTLTGANINP